MKLHVCKAVVCQAIINFNILFLEQFVICYLCADCRGLLAPHFTSTYYDEHDREIIQKVS